MRYALILLMILSMGLTAAASAAAPGLNAAQTTRYMALLPQLRCMQCQNESLASSQAPWAQDVRQRIRAMIAHGQSDRQIKHYLVARYGEYVLYKPPFQASTWALWVGPFVLLVLGVAVLLLVLRRSGGERRTSAEALARVRHWLEDDKP